MSEPRRLHPIAAVSNALRQLKELILPLVFFLVFGSRNGDWGSYYLYGLMAIVGFVFLSGVLSWFRFTYRIEDGELRIEYGLFVRKKRYIPFERIQSFDFSEGILQRAFSLVKVTVETAGSGGMGIHSGDAVLTAVSREEARLIQAYLTEKKSIGEDGSEFPEVKEELVYKITPKELLLLASTSSGVGVVISAVLAFLFQFEEFIPYERLFNGVEAFISNGIVFVAVIIFIGFLIAWAVALIGTMVKYANFTVRRIEDDLVITRGLLEKRQFTIPLHRIQAIRISENLIRQPFGFGAAFIESAGGSSVSEERAKVLVLPIVRKERIPSLLEPHLKGYKLGFELQPAPQRALPRYLVRGSLMVLPILAVSLLFFKQTGFFSLLLLIPAAAWSFLNYRDAGWNLTEQQLTIRYRKIIKTTVYMNRTKIQSMAIMKSYFQQRKQLSTIEAVVKSGQSGSGGKVIDLDEQDSAIIYSWYSFDGSRKGGNNTDTDKPPESEE
ncbi:PH domain-containing protein [Mesobacillus harenae]|uniref:PH domain-containing protein n=1 Tax=Mesobacillus harenae TaxID=2213203 RepID=UPI001580C38C|nr:PH domain-containing protein [Mesobacillus harenae]